MALALRALPSVFHIVADFLGYPHAPRLAASCRALAMEAARDCRGRRDARWILWVVRAVRLAVVTPALAGVFERQIPELAGGPCGPAVQIQKTDNETRLQIHEMARVRQTHDFMRPYLDLIAAINDFSFLIEDGAYSCRVRPVFYELGDAPVEQLADEFNWNPTSFRAFCGAQQGSPLVQHQVVVEGIEEYDAPGCSAYRVGGEEPQDASRDPVDNVYVLESVSAEPPSFTEPSLDYTLNRDELPDAQPLEELMRLADLRHNMPALGDEEKVWTQRQRQLHEILELELRNSCYRAQLVEETGRWTRASRDREIRRVEEWLRIEWRHIDLTRGEAADIAQYVFGVRYHGVETRTPRRAAPDTPVVAERPPLYIHTSMGVFRYVALRDLDAETGCEFATRRTRAAADSVEI